jgi:cold shock protein
MQAMPTCLFSLLEPRHNPPMATGEVKWFDRRKGFGFITPDAGPRDVFVHISAVRRAGFEALAEGERFEFELTQSGDGRLAAFGLRRLEDGATPET